MIELPFNILNHILTFINTNINKNMLKKYNTKKKLIEIIIDYNQINRYEITINTLKREMGNPHVYNMYGQQIIKCKCRSKLKKIKKYNLKINNLKKKYYINP
jgi:hypothetical protein